VIRTALDVYDIEQDANLFAGKGVVLVAGGEYFGPAIVGIHALRQTGSDLPVEVFLADYEEYEPYLCETYLPSLDARCLVLSDFIGDDFDVSHYQFKALALLFSSFSEVLLLDSDSIPLQDPETELFQSAPYIENGLVGWPDFWIGTESPSFYVIAGLTSFPSDLPQSSSESGQLLLDKSRHLKTLLLAVYYNLFGPGYFYELLSQGALGQGDKNTFESAAVVLGAPHYRVKDLPQVIGRYDAFAFKGSAIIQMAPESGQPAFIHANTPKMNAGHLIDEGDLQDKYSKAHLRLWENKIATRKILDSDVEAKIWKILVDTGCELADEVMEWKHRKNLCKRLKAHFTEVFGDGDSSG